MVPETVKQMPQSPTGINAVHGTPVKSHTALQITGTMTAMV
jgi:hypothetical protein